MKAIKNTTITSIVIDSINLALGIFVYPLSIVVINHLFIMEDGLGTWLIDLVNHEYTGSEYDGFTVILLIILGPIAVILIATVVFMVINIIVSILKLIKDIKILKAINNNNINNVILYSKKWFIFSAISMNIWFIVPDIIRLVYIRKATGIRVI